MPLPGLFAYKTDSRYAGAAALDWFDPDPDADEMSAELWSGPIEPGWTHAAAFTDDRGIACLFKYNRTTQTMAIDRVRADGSGLDTCHSQENEGAKGQWDLITSLQVEDPRSARLYAYDRKSGFCRALDLSAGDEPSIAIGQGFGVGSGWSQLSVVEHEGRVHLISYAATDGSVSIIDPQAPDGPAMTGKWDTNWSLMAVLAPPHDGVFLYRTDDGAWELRNLENTPHAVIETGVWRPGWSVTLPFTLNGMAHVLGYEADTGDVEILRLDTQRNAEVVWRFRWSPGWAIQVPLFWRVP